MSEVLYRVKEAVTRTVTMQLSCLSVKSAKMAKLYAFSFTKQWLNLILGNLIYSYKQVTN